MSDVDEDRLLGLTAGGCVEGLSLDSRYIDTAFHRLRSWPDGVRPANNALSPAEVPPAQAHNEARPNP